MKNKVIIFDIDGVLADYDSKWLEYLEKETKIKYKKVEHAKLDLERGHYEKIKQKYRTDGTKTKLNLIDEAVPKMIEELKKKGMKIAIISSRPGGDYKEIYNDTTIWLSKKGIKYDYLFFGFHKHLMAYREFSSKNCWVIEDAGWYAKRFAEFGFKVYWVSGWGFKCPKGVIPVSTVKEAITKIMEEI